MSTARTVTPVRDLADRLRGRFIVFDGPDGAGKSTQRALLAQDLADAGVEVVCARDPGGTEIGDRIRSVLLDFDLSRMAVNCETMLFMASRAQLVAEVIRPALAAGKAVLCDRFITATCAYQGAAGYDPRRVVELGRYAVDDCWPSLSIIFDVPVDEGFGRIGRKAHHAGKHRRKTTGEAPLFDGSRPDAMEARSVEFHRRVRELFLRVADYYPTPVRIVDGRGEPQQVYHRVIECLHHVTA